MRYSFLDHWLPKESLAGITAGDERRMPFSSESPEGENWQDVGMPMIWDRAQGTGGRCSHPAWQVEK